MTKKEILNYLELINSELTDPYHLTKILKSVVIPYIYGSTFPRVDGRIDS